jgi:hypothetical protein
VFAGVPLDLTNAILESPPAQIRDAVWQRNHLYPGLR